MAGFCCRAQGRKVLHKKKEPPSAALRKSGRVFCAQQPFFCANPKGLTLRHEHGNVFFGHMRRCGINGDFPYRVFEIRDGDRARARCVFCTLPAQYPVDAAVRVLCALRHSARGLQRHLRFVRQLGFARQLPAASLALRASFFKETACEALMPEGRQAKRHQRRRSAVCGKATVCFLHCCRGSIGLMQLCALFALCGTLRGGDSAGGVRLPGCCGGFLVFFRGLQFLEVRIAERWPGRAARGRAKVGIRGRDAALTREGEATVCFLHGCREVCF